MYLLKEMPIDQRPRERLRDLGVKALLNEELLAILLRTGQKEHSVLNLAKQVLYHLESIKDLEKMTYHELILIPGIKEAKASTILAAIELGRRLAVEPHKHKAPILKPLDVYHVLNHELNVLEQEHFVVLYLNIKGQIIKKDTIFIGTISQMVIHPREIFNLAIKYRASTLIIAHNHPSGDASPSKADLLATEQIMQAGEVIGIHVTDHIIIGKKCFYSFKEKRQTYL